MKSNGTITMVFSQAEAAALRQLASWQIPASGQAGGRQAGRGRERR